MAITLDGTNGVGIGSSSTENGLNIKQPYATLTLERTNSPTGRFDLKPYNDTLSIRNSSQTDIVKIDNAGRVTMPYQPAFCANGGAYRSGGSREVLQFTSVIANVGNHYNASTYTFTAPVSGNYRFSFSLMTYQGGHSRCQFTKNGSSVGNQFYSDTVDNGEYSRNCGEIIVYLAAGDTMRVDRNVSNESGEIVHVDYRHFAGQLIG